MKRLRWISAGVITMAALVVAIMMTQACGQTPTNVPVRTFEGAQRMDVLCMQVLSTDPNTSGTPIPAVPVPLDNCGPVAAGTTDTSTLFYHLIAVVTQTFRGELAVVDLTAGHVVDTSRSLPGINFLPVGQNPTDVVVTPDAKDVFVAAAETNKPAIYEIPSARLLGDSEILAEPTQAAEQTSLPSWPSCGLPQAPGRMVVVPVAAPSTGDAGASDAGDGGATTQGYEIVVVMPGNGTDEQALAGVIDVAAFDAIAPGSLSPCPLKALVHLDENPASLPKSWTPGPHWPVGLPYADGGLDAQVDLFTTANPSNVVQPSSAYKLPLWQCPSLAHAEGSDAGAVDASAIRLEPGAQAHATGIATDGRYVWIADQSMPFIHVLDTTTPGVLTELAPLVATSMVDPSRTVTTTELAISPTTRDYKRYLYAVDAKQGSVIVYDVTDPVNGPRVPMTRPNPELAPNQAPDRILFPAPVATFTFARHDFAVPGASGPAKTGVLCNPNSNADGTANVGVEYRANGPLSVGLGPKRLRGVFGFATLTNGQIIAVDIDDWDAPCRRPVTVGTNQTGALAIPEPTPFGSNDIDPYHAPTAAAAGASGDGGLFTVSNESMWPIIQPNRIRSLNLVEDDTVGTNGLHNPALLAAPQLFVNGAPVSTTGKPAAILTAAFPETSINSLVPASPVAPPNVFMAHEVPDVHIDQTWNVTYEGILPGFDGVVATITSPSADPDAGAPPAFTSLVFSNPNAFFCGHGVEDHRLGLQRFSAMQVDDAVLATANNTTTLIPPKFDQRVGDYVQITDDIVGAAETLDAGTQIPQGDDDVWHQNPACWAGLTDTQGHPLDAHTDGIGVTPYEGTPKFRQQVCIDKFGAYGADQSTQRDFPILEAHEDRLVVGRYLYIDATNRPSNGRIIAPPDTQAQVDFQLAQCCFHNQAHFHVRTGAEWVALGNLTPYLHHVVADPANDKSCVQSCDPSQVLLSSRVAETTVPANVAMKVAPNRNSPFAMRNAAFSYWLQTPAPAPTDAFFTVSLRDFAWQYQTRGQYQPAAISLTGTTTAVVPQSSMFLAPLGAIAVIDGAAEGLFIVDLNTLLIADGSPFF